MIKKILQNLFLSKDITKEEQENYENLFEKLDADKQKDVLETLKKQLNSSGKINQFTDGTNPKIIDNDDEINKFKNENEALKKQIDEMNSYKSKNLELQQQIDGHNSVKKLLLTSLSDKLSSSSFKKLNDSDNGSTPFYKDKKRPEHAYWSSLDDDGKKEYEAKINAELSKIQE